MFERKNCGWDINLPTATDGYPSYPVGVFDTCLRYLHDPGFILVVFHLAFGFYLQFRTLHSE